MVVRVLGAQHHRPLRVRIERGQVVCPLTRRPQTVTACARCVNLQGSLDGPVAVLLCAASARQARRPRRPRALVFDMDWPDEAD